MRNLGLNPQINVSSLQSTKRKPSQNMLKSNDSNDPQSLVQSNLTSIEQLSPPRKLSLTKQQSKQQSQQQSMHVANLSSNNNQNINNKIINVSIGSQQQQLNSRNLIGGANTNKYKQLQKLQTEGLSYDTNKQYQTNFSQNENQNHDRNSKQLSSNAIVQKRTSGGFATYIDQLSGGGQNDLTENLQQSLQGQGIKQNDKKRTSKGAGQIKKQRGFSEEEPFTDDEDIDPASITWRRNAKKILSRDVYEKTKKYSSFYLELTSLNEKIKVYKQIFDSSNLQYNHMLDEAEQKLKELKKLEQKYGSKVQIEQFQDQDQQEFYRLMRQTKFEKFYGKSPLNKSQRDKNGNSPDQVRKQMIQQLMLQMQKKVSFSGLDELGSTLHNGSRTGLHADYNHKLTSYEDYEQTPVINKDFQQRLTITKDSSSTKNLKADKNSPIQIPSRQSCRNSKSKYQNETIAEFINTDLNIQDIVIKRKSNLPQDKDKAIIPQSLKNQRGQSLKTADRQNPNNQKVKERVLTMIRGVVQQDQMKNTSSQRNQTQLLDIATNQNSPGFRTQKNLTILNNNSNSQSQNLFGDSVGKSSRNEISMQRMQNAFQKQSLSDKFVSKSLEKNQKVTQSLDQRLEKIKKNLESNEERYKQSQEVLEKILRSKKKNKEMRRIQNKSQSDSTQQLNLSLPNIKSIYKNSNYNPFSQNIEMTPRSRNEEQQFSSTQISFNNFQKLNQFNRNLISTSTNQDASKRIPLQTPLQQNRISNDNILNPVLESSRATRKNKAKYSPNFEQFKKSVLSRNQLNVNTNKKLPFKSQDRKKQMFQTSYNQRYQQVIQGNDYSTSQPQISHINTINSPPFTSQEQGQARDLLDHSQILDSTPMTQKQNNDNTPLNFTHNYNTFNQASDKQSQLKMNEETNFPQIEKVEIFRNSQTVIRSLNLNNDQNNIEQTIRKYSTQEVKDQQNSDQHIHIQEDDNYKPDFINQSSIGRAEYNLANDQMRQSKQKLNKVRKENEEIQVIINKIKSKRRKVKRNKNIDFMQQLKQATNLYAQNV